MAAPVFIWTPSFTTNLQKKPRVQSAQFGDGYEQRMRDGINSNPRTWGIVFNGIKDADANAIMGFLDGLAGVDYFTFTDPEGVTAKYTCRDYTRSWDAYNSNTLNATFKECFDQ